MNVGKNTHQLRSYIKKFPFLRQQAKKQSKHLSSSFQRISRSFLSWGMGCDVRPPQGGWPLKIDYACPGAAQWSPRAPHWGLAEYRTYIVIYLAIKVRLACKGVSCQFLNVILCENEIRFWRKISCFWRWKHVFCKLNYLKQLLKATVQTKNVYVYLKLTAFLTRGRLIKIDGAESRRGTEWAAPHNGRVKRVEMYARIRTLLLIYLQL